MDWTQIITLVIGILGASSGIVALYQIRASRRKLEAETGKTQAEERKVDAEAKEINVKADINLFEKLKELYDQRFVDMETSLDALNAKVLSLEMLVKKMSYLVTCLVNQVIRLGKKPVATLDDLDKYSVEEWKHLAEK